MRILVKDCGYDTLENRMLRDGIVLQSMHPAVMEKCFDKGEELTLDVATLNIGRNYETSQESIRTVGVDEDQKVHVVKKFKKKPYDSRKKGQEESEEQTSETKGECRRCASPMPTTPKLSATMTLPHHTWWNPQEKSKRAPTQPSHTCTFHTKSGRVSKPPKKLDL